MTSEKILATIAAWKSKLLDLTKRNRALNFKVNKVSTVTVINELPAEIFRLLYMEKKALKFLPSEKHESVSIDEKHEADDFFGDVDVMDHEMEQSLPLFAPYQKENLSSNYTDEILQTSSSADNLDKSLRRIEEQARTIVEEQGVNALFLTLGMLHYTESKDSRIVFKAPLILLPVELSRKSAREDFSLKITDEEVIVNPSLTEYLQRNYGIILPEISNEEEQDLQSFFQNVSESITLDTWKVTNEIYLSLFSFQKLVIYKDLEKNAANIANHKIFKQIINKEGNTFIGLPEEIRTLPLDKYFAPEQCIQVVDADSSQLRAIAAVSQNYDLVLEGPPGTGKSQTITNLLAQALSTGKSVLFVAEKMAALDVVYRRLCEVGLGEFCLELHSTKANKRSVMDELKKTLNASLEVVISSQTATARLPIVRDHLTDYINAVHTSYGTLGVSPFSGYGKLDQVLDAPKMIFHADIGSVSGTNLTDVLREINDFITTAEFIGSSNQHPWRGTTKVFYSESELDDVEAIGKQIIEKLSGLVIEAEKLESILGLPKLRTFPDIETASIVAATIARSPGAPFEVLVNESWNSAPPEALRLIEEGQKNKNLRMHLLQNFSLNIFEHNPTDDIAHVERKSQGIFGFLAFFDRRYRAIKKRWFSFRLPSYSGSLLEQINEMKLVASYLQKQASLESSSRIGGELFGGLWQGEASNWEALQRYIQWVLEFRQIFIKQGLNEKAISTASTKSPDVNFVQTLRRSVIEISNLLESLCIKVGWKEDYFEKSEIETISARIYELVNNLTSAHRWASYETVRQKLNKSFAKEILSWIDSEQVSFAHLSAAFRRAFYQKWLSQIFQERLELREFHTLTHEQRIAEFRILDEQILKQNRSNLIAKMRGALQSRLQKSPVREQMLTLRTQLNRQRGLMPLRVMMTRCPEAVRTIKPCLMMSPQSVAQLLDAEKTKFDLIVFDEASQMPTEDAVGAILRGKQVVVVGDPKQLPPTNFFAVTSGQVNIEKDEDGLPMFEDSQSILEEIMSSGVPSTSLRWHYRSLHETLIKFSNVNFYNSDLFTFPSVETEAYDSGLQFEFVPDGIYEGKGLNVAEARRVADAVIAHAKKEPDVSLGVGTFNMRQQTAILDELTASSR